MLEWKIDILQVKKKGKKDLRYSQVIVTMKDIGLGHHRPSF